LGLALRLAQSTRGAMHERFSGGGNFAPAYLGHRSSSPLGQKSDRAELVFSGWPDVRIGWSPLAPSRRTHRTSTPSSETSEAVARTALRGGNNMQYSNMVFF